MVLIHKAKDGQVKSSLRLDELHHELEIDSLVLRGSGASNILLCKVSFDCLVTDSSDVEHRDYLSFDLKIPGVNSEKEAIFSYDTVQTAFGSKENLYAALRYFYECGRDVANVDNVKHGTYPDYDPDSSSHDFFIRHSEQSLVAYLALPQAAAMLRNRLKTEIRGKYVNAASVKVYNMGLHMHSTKTCCAPCEYALLGLMNEAKGFKQGGIQLGFLANFQQACAVPNDQLGFTFPKQSAFRLLVTVTASNPDATHQKQPTYTVKKLKATETAPSRDILVKKQSTFQQIFSTMVGTKYDPRKLPAVSNLTDKTVVISGSKATSGSPGTANKAKVVRNVELAQVASQMAALKV
jgi:hypothetical protein